MTSTWGIIIGVAKILFAVASALAAFWPYFQDGDQAAQLKPEERSRRRSRTTGLLATAIGFLVLGEVGGLIVNVAKDRADSAASAKRQQEQVAAAELNVRRTLTPFRDFSVTWYLDVPVSDYNADIANLKKTILSAPVQDDLPVAAGSPMPPPARNSVALEPPYTDRPDSGHVARHGYNPGVYEQSEERIFERRNGKVYVTNQSRVVTTAPMPFGSCIDPTPRYVSLNRPGQPQSQVNWNFKYPDGIWRHVDASVSKAAIRFYPREGTKSKLGFRDASFLSLLDVPGSEVTVPGSAVAESDAVLVLVFDIPQLGVYEARCKMDEYGSRLGT